MNKIECEICGTQYPDNATACPICGWTHNDAAAADAAASAGADEFDLDFLNEDNSVVEEVEEPAPAPVKKNKSVFDYDAVNAPSVPEAEDEEVDENEDDEEDEEEDDEEDEEESGGSTVLVVILVILIVVLLLASGFIFWRYYLPNHRAAEETAPTTELIDVQPSEAETTEPEIVTVPCTGLSLVSGMERLSSEGQHWLLHIKAVPEDTTDEIVFVSEDESVVTVNEEGRVTAVGEGETRIVITCGAQKIECPAVVDYTPEETVTVVETAAPAEVAAPEEESVSEEEEVPEETSAPASSDVTLKLKRTDITFGVRGVYIELVLDCDLTPDQVTWSSRNSNVASVNSKGEVTAVGPGLTVITAKYGDQSVECIVRCNF